MKFEYTITRMDFTTAGEASSNIKKVLRLIGIDSKVIRRASIACYEAEINIAIHSDGGKIYLHVEPEKIRIVARDNGPGIRDISKAMEEGFSTATTEVREMGFGAGMGLPNMKRVSDEFSIDSVYGEFTEIEMTLYYKGDTNG